MVKHLGELPVGEICMQQSAVGYLNLYYSQCDKIVKIVTKYKLKKKNSSIIHFSDVCPVNFFSFYY